MKDLKIISNKNNLPSTNKGEKDKPKPKRRKGIYVFNPLDYEYSLNERVYVNEEGKKQLHKLKKPYYHVVAIRQANLNDMLVNVMDLNVKDDENVKNPYLAHHFSPYKDKEDEEAT